MKYSEVLKIYTGSDGEATKSLYADLCKHGMAGAVAINLFRAHKCSARAKVYKGGIRGQASYKSMAYDRKRWSIENLDKALVQYAGQLGIVWGWKRDPSQPVHCWLLYVELPTGQVSFHTDARGNGPDYPGEWDKARGAGPERIAKYCARVLAGKAVGEFGHADAPAA